jgi:hypothetical protein
VSAEFMNVRICRTERGWDEMRNWENEFSRRSIYMPKLLEIFRKLRLIVWKLITDTVY